MKVKVTQPCPTLCNPMDYTIHGILQARIPKWVQPFPSPGDLPNPGIESRSPMLQADSLPAEPPGKAKNTGVGNLLQQIFPTQELSQGLLYCRQIKGLCFYMSRKDRYIFIMMIMNFTYITKIYFTNCMKKTCVCVCVFLSIDQPFLCQFYSQNRSNTKHTKTLRLVHDL